jgi:polysaccharide pyruvyl transferase WcaK-like protein
LNSKRPTRITVLGNFSGRNAGDAAILGGLLKDVTEPCSHRELEFLVPTINTRFVRNSYAEYPVRAVSLLPTNLSLKILGLPVTRSVLGADLVLVTDAILFDRRLYNPLFNYLHTLSWVLPLAARRGVPIVLYNVSLGPVRTERGRRCLRRVLASARKVIVRDELSVDLAREVHPGGLTPIVGADCALSTVPAPEERIEHLAKEHGVMQSGRPVLGFNVNVYVDVYVRGNSRGIGDERFQGIVAAVLDRAVRELDVDVLMVETQPMDLTMARGVLRRVEEQDRVGMVSNPPLGYQELAGMLARVDAFVGMRTHSLILASSAHTPVGGIIAYAKNRGYLSSIDRADGMLEFADFNEDTLWNLVHSTWTQRDSLRERFAVSVERERLKAKAAARELGEWLD